MGGSFGIRLAEFLSRVWIIMTTLFVHYLLHSVSKTNVADDFSRYGRILHIHMEESLISTTYSYITFEDAEAAKKVLEEWAVSDRSISNNGVPLLEMRYADKIPDELSSVTEDGTESQLEDDATNEDVQQECVETVEVRTIALDIMARRVFQPKFQASYQTYFFAHFDDKMQLP